MNKVFFLDIDDCIIETSHLGDTELSAIKNKLDYFQIPNSDRVVSDFRNFFHLQYDLHQGKPLTVTQLKTLTVFQEKMKELEKEIIPAFGLKKWSREVMIYLSAQKNGVDLNKIQISETAAALWKAIADYTPYYPDSREFLINLINRNVPFYLITSSDCRLQFDEINKTFIYDPQYSKNLKMKRLQKLIDLGIPAKRIFVAEPYDKPNPWVFQQALDMAHKEISGEFESVMVGDSVHNDLEPAKKIGIQTLIWIARHVQNTEKEHIEGVQVVNSLLTIEF